MAPYSDPPSYLIIITSPLTKVKKIVQYILIESDIILIKLLSRLNLHNS